MSDTEHKTVKEAVEALGETKKEIKEALEKLDKIKKQLEDLIDDGPIPAITFYNVHEEKEFFRVDVAFSKLSSVQNWNNASDKATDGDVTTAAVTKFEALPWYSAELGLRFSAIKLNITGFLIFSAEKYQTVYTVDNGVETLCAKLRIQQRKKFNWTVICETPGTGFKISASRDNGESTAVNLYEVTIEVKV